MSPRLDTETRTARSLAPMIASPIVRFVGLLGLCAAYIQGGLVKLTDFGGAIGEMTHFGLMPAAPFAVAVIVLELGASVLVLSGRLRWLGALVLALFTLLATFLANRFWEMGPPDRFGAANSFFEHLGLVGGFLLVAHEDLKTKRRNGTIDAGR